MEKTPDPVDQTPIEVTAPVMIDMAMPTMPTYPSNMRWTKTEDGYCLPTDDVDRLIAFIARLREWGTAKLPQWLQYYGLDFNGRIPEQKE